MAHPKQQIWAKEVKKVYLDYFIKKRVLDVGSLDINGNNKELFINCEYIGVDVIAGKNVDVVSIAHELKFENESFDTIISTNAFEHDMYYSLTCRKIIDLLKPKGLLFFTAAYSWKEHGTLKKAPTHSGTTKMGDKWANYYKNLTEKDIISNIPKSEFSVYNIKIFDNDIRFVGIKK